MVILKTASAFCPGHITGFFRIRDQWDETYKKGSVGSGFNTAAGALTGAFFTRSGNAGNMTEPVPGVLLDLRVDGISVSAGELPVTRDMFSRFINLYNTRANLSELGNGGVALVLDTRFDLPLSQGFGMSGAGLVSQVLTLNLLFDLPLSREDCIRIAHESEIIHGTGLGDIPAQSVGGFTIREREGLPPHGIVHGFPAANRVILAVFGAGMPTRNIILNDEKRRSINRHGEGMVGQLLTRFQSRSLENGKFDPGSVETLLAEMTSLSFRFAQDTGLMDAMIRELCLEINDLGTLGSSMCMLGNSIFAIFPRGTSTGGELYRKIKGILLEKCEVFETAISPAGARAL